MQLQSVSDPLLSVSAEDGEALRSLLDWLRHEDTLRGRVRPAQAPMRLGEMGGVLNALEIAHSAAATRVLVLDCCFSGRAIEAMTNDQGVVGGQLEVAGTYTLTSTPANAPAHAPPGDRFTAFTGALLRALDAVAPLTLDQIYVVVDRDLAARNFPRPQRRAVNTAGDLALSRGPATSSPPSPPTPTRCGSPARTAR